MEVHTKYIGILSENEKIYFAQLKGVIESADELSSLQITKTPSHYNFRIAPSIPKYTNNIINALTQFHNTLGIRLNFSKSIKTTGAINFKINLPE
jgi:hypothetical protein